MSDKKNYWKGMTFRQKVDYFFQYYAGWVLAALVVLAFILVYVFFINKNSEPDLNVTILGPTTVSEENEIELKNFLSQYTLDVNIDDIVEINIDFIPHSLNGAIDNPEIAESNSNYESRFFSSLNTGKPRILIVSREHFNAYARDEQFEGLFADITEFYSDAIESYGVEVENTALSEFSFIPKDYVVLATEIGGNTKVNDNSIALYEQTVRILTELINK